MDGRTTDHGHPISSPCEPNGSGELINFVELLSLMLHAKFQNHRPSGSGEEDFKVFLLFIAMAAILVM